MQNHLEGLIKACKKGNHIAQMQLYDTYAQAMFTVACRYLRDEEEAKDIMQESFLKAFVKIESYNQDTSFGAWLKRIVINQALDTLKKRKLEFSNEEVETLKVSDDDWSFNSAISKQDILDAIETLKDKHKVVVKLYLIEGYDHQEISEILNIPIKTSRTHLSRGKTKLRALLKSKYNEARY
jgi:RNA polymerase sigma-70 factor (ECF subfamily)